MSCDIIMGNVKPLREKIARLEQHVKNLESTIEVMLDKPEKYVRDISVEGDLTGLKWSGGDV